MGNCPEPAMSVSVNTLLCVSHTSLSKVRSHSSGSRGLIVAPRAVYQIKSVAKYELIKYFRGRLLAILVLTAVISAILLIVPRAVGSQYPNDPTQFTLHMLGFLGTALRLQLQ